LAEAENPECAPKDPYIHSGENRLQILPSALSGEPNRPGNNANNNHDSAKRHQYLPSFIGSAVSHQVNFLFNKALF
jgi:hypothetical protein